MKYKTLEEYRLAASKRSLEYYHKNKDNEEYKIKRREYQKKRYREMIEKLKAQS